MDPSEVTPKEIWLNIMNYMRFQDILIMQMLTSKLRGIALSWINNTQNSLKSLPHNLITIPNYKIIGSPQNSIKQINILCAKDDINFYKPTIDQQPRNANRGLGFTDNKWVWIRGPFEHRINVGHETEIGICIFQEDNFKDIFCHLKRYEVEFISDFIDKTRFICNVAKPEKKTTHCIIS